MVTVIFLAQRPDQYRPRAHAVGLWSFKVLCLHFLGLYWRCVESGETPRKGSALTSPFQCLVMTPWKYYMPLTLSLPTILHFWCSFLHGKKVKLTKIAAFENFIARKNCRAAGIQAGSCTATYNCISRWKTFCQFQWHRITGYWKGSKRVNYAVEIQTFTRCICGSDDIDNTSPPVAVSLCLLSL